MLSVVFLWSLRLVFWTSLKSSILLSENTCILADANSEYGKKFRNKGVNGHCQFCYLPSRSPIINRASSRYDLHDEYPKTVHIASLIQHSCAGILRCHIPEKNRQTSMNFLQILSNSSKPPVAYKGS